MVNHGAFSSSSNSVTTMVNSRYYRLAEGSSPQLEALGRACSPFACEKLLVICSPMLAAPWMPSLLSRGGLSNLLWQVR